MGPVTARGQDEWRAEAAVIRIAPGNDAPARGAVTAALSWFGVERRSTPFAGLSATLSGDSVAAAQGIVAASIPLPWVERAVLDVGGIAAAYGIAGGAVGNGFAVFGRQHLRLGGGGVWLGGALGATRREGLDRTAQGADVGAWIAVPFARVTASVAGFSTDDFDLLRASGVRVSPFATRVTLADAAVSVRLAAGPFQVDAVTGRRFGNTLARVSQDFALGAFAWVVDESLALVASGGLQLADPLRGTPQWRYGSVGVRITARTVPRQRGSTPVVAASVDAERVGGGALVLLVVAPGAAAVELAADFTDWAPIALARTDRGWEAQLAVPPGPHRVQVRLDGGRWSVPRNLVAVADEFGARAGLLVVPD